MQMIDVLTKLREIAERSPEEIGRAIAAAEAMSGRPVTEAESDLPVTFSKPPPKPMSLGQTIGAGYRAAQDDMADKVIGGLRKAGEIVRPSPYGALDRTPIPELPTEPLDDLNDALWGGDKRSPASRTVLGKDPNWGPKEMPVPPWLPPLPPMQRADGRFEPSSPQMPPPKTYNPPYYNPAADHRIPPDDPMGQVSGFDPPPLHARPGAWDHEVDSKEYKPGMNPYGDPNEMPEKKPEPKPKPNPEPMPPPPNEPDDDDGEWIEEADPAMADMKRLAGLPNSVTEMSEKQKKYFGGKEKGKGDDKSDASGKKPDHLDFDNDGNEKESMTKALKDKEKKKVAEDVQITLSGSDAVLAEILKLAGQIGAKTTKGNDVVTAPTPPNPTLGMPTPNAPLPALTLPGEGPMGDAGPMGGSGGMGMPSTGPIPSLASMMGDEPMMGERGMQQLMGGMGDEPMMDGAYDANTTPNPTTMNPASVLPKGNGIGSQSGVTAPVVGGASTNPFESRVTFR